MDSSARPILQQERRVEATTPGKGSPRYNEMVRSYIEEPYRSVSVTNERPTGEN